MIIWLLENSTSLRDFGVLLFSGIGAFFTYRAWRQKHDEIKEKYFERRFELYTTVFRSAQQGLQSSDKFEWWVPLSQAADRAGFLIGPEAKKCVGSIHELLIEHHNKINDDDTAVRLSSRVERDRVSEELKKFHSILEPYLRVG